MFPSSCALISTNLIAACCTDPTLYCSECIFLSEMSLGLKKKVKAQVLITANVQNVPIYLVSCPGATVPVPAS